MRFDEKGDGGDDYSLLEPEPMQKQTRAKLFRAKNLLKVHKGLGTLGALRASLHGTAPAPAPSPAPAPAPAGEDETFVDEATVPGSPPKRAPGSPSTRGGGGSPSTRGGGS